MSYEAKIICDSTTGVTRLTTFQVRYPRFIHSEVMTHRVFSRNASSSRAIPVQKQIDAAIMNPAMPIRFMKNQPGMQASVECNDEEEGAARKVWLEARDNAVNSARAMVRLDVHKQFANRLLEPFQWISVVITATDWDNFWALRCHPDAQPEFEYLASKMRRCYQESQPSMLGLGDWHLPYIRTNEWLDYGIIDLCKISSARCARVSYLTHDNKDPKPQEDIALFERLVAGEPKHASPVEHQAVISEFASMFLSNFEPPWLQFRKFIEIGETDPVAYLATLEAEYRSTEIGLPNDL